MARLPPLLALALGLAAALVPGHAAWRAATGPDGGWWAAAFVVNAAAVLVGSGLAAAVLARAGGRSAARWLALFLVAFPASFALTGRYLEDGTALDILLRSLSMVASGLGAIAVAGFAARFPRPIAPEEAEGAGRGWMRLLQRLVLRRRRFVVASAMTMSGWAALLLFDGPEPLHGLAALLAMATVVGTLGLVLGALATFRLGYRLAPPEERGGLIWVLEGLLLVALALLALVATGVYEGIREALDISTLEIPYGLQSLVASGFLLAGLLCLSLAILYHGTIDPRLVVRRTTVYGLLGLLLTAAFAAAEAFAEAFFADLAGAASVGTSVLIALAFAPLLRRVDRWVDGRFAGARDGEKDGLHQREEARSTPGSRL